jgi:hypothetical protein
MKTLKTRLIVLLLVMAIFGCKKNNDSNKEEITKPVFNLSNYFKIKNSIEKDENLLKFYNDLENNIDKNSELINVTTDKEKTIVYQINNNQDIAVKTEKNNYKFIIYQLKNEEIIDEKIVNLIPTEKNTEKITTLTAFKLYNKKLNNFTGTMVNISNRKEYFNEYNFENGKWIGFKQLIPKVQNTIKSSSEICTDWYWVITINNIVISETYLFTTCTGGCEQTRQFDNNLEPISSKCGGHSGGGGGNSLNGAYKETTYTWIPYEKFTPVHRKLTCIEKVTGIRYPYSAVMPADSSYFISNTHIGQSFSSETYPVFNPNTGITTNVQYGTLQSGFSSNTVLPHLVRAYFLGSELTCQNETITIDNFKNWFMFYDF